MTHSFKGGDSDQQPEGRNAWLIDPEVAEPAAILTCSDVLIPGKRHMLIRQRIEANEQTDPVNNEIKPEQ